MACLTLNRLQSLMVVRESSIQKISNRIIDLEVFSCDVILRTLNNCADKI